MTQKDTNNLSEIKFYPIEIAFEKIDTVYPALKSIQNIESNLEYLLDTTKHIDAGYLHVFLNMHPFVVVQENDRYYCLGNIRLFRVAKIVLDPKTQINCLLLRENNTELIEKLATTDFYLNHLLFSLRSLDSGDQLCRVWQVLEDVKKEITPEAKQLKSLSEILSVSRKKGYLRRKKQSNVESKS